jgi:hypothetical protein
MWQTGALESMRELREVGVNDFDIIVVPGHLFPMRSTVPRAGRYDGRSNPTASASSAQPCPRLDQNLASCVPSERAYAVDVYAKTLRLAADLGLCATSWPSPAASASLLPPPARGFDGLARGEHRAAAAHRGGGERPADLLEMIPLSRSRPSATGALPRSLHGCDAAARGLRRRQRGVRRRRPGGGPPTHRARASGRRTCRFDAQDMRHDKVASQRELPRPSSPSFARCASRSA